MQRALVAIATAASCVSSQPDCTQIGCSSESATLTAALAMPSRDLDGGTVELCYDSTCESSLISLRDSRLGASPFRPDSLSFVLDAATDADGLASVLTVSVTVTSGTGDKLRLRVRDADSNQVVARDWRVTAASTTYPNGERCDTGCVRLELAE